MGRSVSKLTRRRVEVGILLNILWVGCGMNKSWNFVNVFKTRVRTYISKTLQKKTW